MKKKEENLVHTIVTDKIKLKVVCTEIKTLQNNPILDEIVMSMVDTFMANKDKCVGLAANQIGFPKRVILVRMNQGYVIMINPEIKVSTMHGRIRKKESCLSHPGKITKVNRYKRLTVSYEPYSMTAVPRITNTYTGIIARIIQHEVDHLNGVLI